MHRGYIETVNVEIHRRFSLIWLPLIFKHELRPILSMVSAPKVMRAFLIIETGKDDEEAEVDKNVGDYCHYL